MARRRFFNCFSCSKMLQTFSDFLTFYKKCWDVILEATCKTPDLQLIDFTDKIFLFCEFYVILGKGFQCKIRTISLGGRNRRCECTRRLQRPDLGRYRSLNYVVRCRTAGWNLIRRDAILRITFGTSAILHFASQPNRRRAHCAQLKVSASRQLGLNL